MPVVLSLAVGRVCTPRSSPSTNERPYLGEGEGEGEGGAVRASAGVRVGV